ncbi:hypothetical protein NBRC111894_3252 [Sporolactobacillus inulinus]|uniref:Uncharacterized protein n=1 Tax=Sporolactobacillus inulinus TaxID=2078 RepID=A0A4Y1ZGU8_9BACL|nr:hypothetical protein NBRC111894_3252 [Sporolactobacillus inulinus]
MRVLPQQSMIRLDKLRLKQSIRKTGQKAPGPYFRRMR